MGVGSGNPEEGELRPQLLDRFGIYAKITTTRDANIRVQIVIHRSMFDSSPDEFCRNYYDSQKNLHDRISYAHTQLHRVEFDYKIRINIAKLCSELEIDGLRGDIVTNRARKAFIAFDDSINHIESVRRVAPLCLGHRLRNNPLEQINHREKVIEVWSQISNLS